MKVSKKEPKQNKKNAIRLSDKLQLKGLFSHF